MLMALNNKNKKSRRWLKLSSITVLAMFTVVTSFLSSCAPMTSIRNGLESQSYLRDKITGNNMDLPEENISELKQNDREDQISKIADFEKKIIASKQIPKTKTTESQKATTIIQADSNPNESKELAIAGVPSKDEMQDENIDGNSRKLLTFKEQFNGLENKHDKLKTKVNQIEEELKFLRGQVIALNSRKETFIAKDAKPAETKKQETNNIIHSDENIADSKVKSVEVSKHSENMQKLELAEQFYNKGNYNDAIEAYTEAIKEISKNNIKSEANYKIAMSYYHLKKYEKSIEYFDTVCSLSENMYKDDAQIQIAEANMKLGKIDEAKKAYKNVLAVYPKSRHIPKARKMLQQL